MSHEKHDTLNWLNLADKFARDGDPKGMRACAKELWQLDAENMDGAAIMANIPRSSLPEPLDALNTTDIHHTIHHYLHR